MNPNNTQLYRKQGQSQVVDAQGNLVPFGGDLNSLQVITPGSLAPQPKINLDGTIVNPPNGNDVVSGATAGAMGFDADYQRMLDLQAPSTNESSAMDKLLADLTSAEQGTTGRGAAQIATDEALGINAMSKRRAETTQPRLKSALAEYEALKTEFEQQKADIEAGAGRKGLTTGAVMGQQGAVDRAKLARLNSKASEIGLIEAEDLALKGQIDEAQKRADRAVDLLFADRESAYTTKLNQYNRIKDLLTEEEKKRGKALEYALAKEKEKIDAEKETAKSIEKMLLDATPNAPASVISNAKAIQEKGGSALEVAQALGKYGGDYLKTELLKQQIETEKAQRSKIYTDISKTQRETDLLGQPVGVDGVIATLPKSSQERYYKLQGDFDQATKNYRGAIDSASSITALSKDATPQQQTAIIFQYMKTLDPTSTVREGEFALVGATAGLSDRAVNALKRLDNGSRLNETQIKDIVGAAQILAENAKKNLEMTSNEYDRRAVKFGLPKGLFYEPQANSSPTNTPEAEAMRAKIKAANPSIATEKTEGTEIIENINNGVMSFILPTNQTKK